MVKSSEFIGVVMLGGLSSRMGLDKSELSFDGQTMAQRATNTLKNAGAKHVVASSGNKPCGIKDQVLGKGPISGLHAVMKHASTQDAAGFVFLPVDMPLVTISMIKMLVDAGFNSASVCQFKNWPFPCYLPNNADVIHALEQSLNENLLAVKPLLKKLNAVELETRECNQDVFMNLNSPDHWAKYKRLRSKNLSKGQ